jgi:RNA polymerase sigma-70 factor (ECF subfamily)
VQLSPTQTPNLLLLETEKLLLENFSQGSLTAFWQFWQLHQEYLYYRCKNWIGGNSTEAEEALSQVMLKAWEKFPHYAHQITKPKAWLTRLAHNLCVDIHRKRRRQASISENIEEIAGKESEIFTQDHDSPESALLNRELMAYLNREIAALPPRLRETFKLRCYQELSYSEIARKLNISEDNVGKNLQKAREILQKRVNNYLSGLDTSVIDEVSPKPLETEVPQIPTITIDYQITALCLPTQLHSWFH